MSSQPSLVLNLVLVSNMNRFPPCFQKYVSSKKEKSAVDCRDVESGFLLSFFTPDRPFFKLTCTYSLGFSFFDRHHSTMTTYKLCPFCVWKEWGKNSFTFFSCTHSFKRMLFAEERMLQMRLGNREKNKNKMCSHVCKEIYERTYQHACENILFYLLQIPLTMIYLFPWDK